MQFAYGGSASSGSADALVNELGLTGIPFTNVANGCATGGSSLLAAVAAVKSGEFDTGLVVGAWETGPPLTDLQATPRRWVWAAGMARPG